MDHSRAMFAMKHTPVTHHSRNGVFEDQLLLAVVFQKHGIFVEGPYLSGELDAADQIYGDRGLVLANRIQECVLNVLCRLVFHMPISYFPLSFWVRLDCTPLDETSTRGQHQKPRSHQIPQCDHDIGVSQTFQPCGSQLFQKANWERGS